MASVDYITKAGDVFQRVPYRRSRGLAAIDVVTRPTATGTLTGGSTLTAVGGTYDVPTTRVRFRWSQFGSGVEVKSSVGATFQLATVGTDTTVVLYEDVKAQDGRTAIGTSNTYAVPAVSAAPAITSLPTLSPTTGEVGTAISMTYGAVTGSPAPTNTRRWLLGTSLVGTGASYTPVAADVGKSLVGEQTASNGVGTPAVALSAPVVITSTSTSVYATPTTASAFQTALVNAPSNSIIEIPSGNKSNWGFTNGTTKNRSNVVIRPVDRGNPPTFISTGTTALFNFTNWSGLTWDGLNFECDLTPLLTRNGPCAFVTFSCNAFKFTNCRFRNWFGAIETHTSGDDWEVSYCEVRQQWCDGFRMYQLRDNLRVHHNHIWDTNVQTGFASDPDWHPDMLQLATGDNGLGTTNMVVEDNFFDSAQTTFQWANGFHGILILSEAVQRGAASNWPKNAHKNATVRRNDMRGVTSIGIGLGGVEGGLIRDNRMRRLAAAPTIEFMTPQVYFIRSSEGGKLINATGIDIINNAWPLVGGETSLRYGNSTKTADNYSATKTGNLNVADGNPVGWSGFDVTKGIYGPYGQG